MLKHRLLMSALLIPAMIGLFVWDHHLGQSAPVLLVLVLLISARAVWELTALARNAGLRPDLVLMVIGSWSLLVPPWWNALVRWDEPWSELPPTLQPLGQHLGSVGVIFGLVSVGFLFHAVFRFPLPSGDDNQPSDDRRPLGLNICSTAFELFTLIYVGLFLSLTCRLRWEIGGYFALGALVVATKMGDVGAYTFGRLIGGAKMTPQLSPGKTWAGGFGHLVTAGLCSLAWLCWLGPMLSSEFLPWKVLPATVFGVVVGFAGLIGDLAESLIKRDVGVKDAPALLPGFGGLLDLMDSILLAGPVAYAMWHLLR